MIKLGLLCHSPAATCYFHFSGFFFCSFSLHLLQHDIKRAAYYRTGTCHFVCGKTPNLLFSSLTHSVLFSLLLHMCSLFPVAMISLGTQATPRKCFHLDIIHRATNSKHFFFFFGVCGEISFKLFPPEISS